MGNHQNHYHPRRGRFMRVRSRAAGGRVMVPPPVMVVAWYIELLNCIVSPICVHVLVCVCVYMRERERGRDDIDLRM